MEINKKYELLAPVGDIEMFEAAIYASADAVYLAADKFGARAYASNFDLEQLKKLLIKAHKNSIKVYLTVNTLIKDSEFEKLYQYLKALKDIGVDALIVQDLGAYHFIKRHFSGFEIHASTQMTVNNFYGAKFLSNLGFDRVVIGRETSLEEIKEIKKNLDLDIEFFVHGSLCVCVSGQCLMSSLIGQRSGNRGRCAQPCRKSYDIFDNSGRNIGKISDTYLSARDLMTIDHINKIIKAGVFSLKIEGRMKKPEYVYSVVRQYRRALNNLEYVKDDLALVSNRKFTKGLFFGDLSKNFYNSQHESSGLEVGFVKNKGLSCIYFEKNLSQGDVISLTTKKNKKLTMTLTDDYSKGQVLELKGYKDLLNNSKIYQIYSKNINQNLVDEKNKEKPIELDIQLFAKVGEKLSARAKALDKDVNIEVDYFIENALNNQTSKDDIYKQMQRLGNSDYKLRSLQINKTDNIFIAKSRLNELRRELVEKIDLSFIKSDIKLIKDFEQMQSPIYEKHKVYKLSYEFFNNYNKGLDLAVFSRIYTHNLGNVDELRELFDGEIYFVMPRMLEKSDYDKLIAQIDDYINLIDGFSLSSLGDIEALSPYKKPLHLEPTINIFNSYSLEFFRNIGIQDFSLSHELNHEEISGLNAKKDDNIEIQAYGKISQMLLKYCPASIVKGCLDDSKCKNCNFNNNLVLSNKLDKMVINRAYGYSEVLTDKTVNLINEINIIDRTNISMLRIVDRGESDLLSLVDMYVRVFIKKEEVKYKGQTYTGHFNLGVI